MLRKPVTDNPQIPESSQAREASQALPMADDFGSAGAVDLSTSSRPSRLSVPAIVRKHSASRYLVSLALLLLIVFFAVVRFRLRDIVLERDEGEFAYGAQLMLEGVPLYESSYTLKMPGTYAAYAGILAAFGQSPAGIHTGLIFVNAATTLLVFFLVTRMFGRLAAIVAAASYAVLSSSPSVLGFAGHATHFVVLCAVGGLCLLLAALEGDSNWLVFASGALLGMAFLMKQPGIFFLVFAGLYVIWRRLGFSRDWKAVAWHLAALWAGGLLPFIVTCLLTWHSGTFQKFWFWAVSYATRYGTNATLPEGIAALKHTATLVVRPAGAIWAIAGLGLSTALWNRRARENYFFLAGFLLFSFLGVSSGLIFREHYFILMLPAVSMLAGVAVGCATEALQSRTRSLLLVALPLLIFVVGLSASIYKERYFLFFMSPAEDEEWFYGGNPFPEALELSRYIARITPPQATVAIVGSEPEIYFYSHRRAVTGHVVTYPLLEPKYGRILQKQMQEEIESSPPDILVLVSDPASWVGFHNHLPRDAMLNWAMAYARKFYNVTAIAKRENGSIEYLWGEQAQGHSLTLDYSIIVLKRMRGW